MKLEDGDLGWCHRFPPIRPFDTGDGFYHTESFSNQWCGEFEHKLITPEIQQDSILSLGLSVRSQNALLHRSGMTSIAEVENMKDSDLLKIKNFGACSLWEVRNAIKEHRGNNENKST